MAFLVADSKLDARPRRRVLYTATPAPTVGDSSTNKANWDPKVNGFDADFDPRLGVLGRSTIH